VARSPDPVSSKVSRFVFGAVGGGITAWFSLRGFAGSAAAVYGTIAVFAGLVAMLLGGLLSKRMSR
jgi:hypothetical protein